MKVMNARLLGKRAFQFRYQANVTAAPVPHVEPFVNAVLVASRRMEKVPSVATRIRPEAAIATALSTIWVQAKA